MFGIFKVYHITVLLQIPVVLFIPKPVVLKHVKQRVTKRCRLNWPITPSYTYEPKRGGRGGVGCVAGSQPMSTAIHWSPNKLWRSNSIFNLWCENSGLLEIQILPGLFEQCTPQWSELQKPIGRIHTSGGDIKKESEKTKFIIIYIFATVQTLQTDLNIFMISTKIFLLVLFFCEWPQFLSNDDFHYRTFVSMTCPTTLL
jgi:hypothetical protein